MRETLTWILIAIALCPLGPMTASGFERGGLEPPLTLEERLADMSVEVKRFLDSNPSAELGQLRGPHKSVEPTSGDEDASVLRLQEHPARLEIFKAARLRAKISSLEVGAEMTVVVRGGLTLHGELSRAFDNHFKMIVEFRSEGDRVVRKETKEPREFAYDSIESANSPHWSGWFAPERLRYVAKGKKVDVLLLDGEKVSGRVVTVTDDRFTLDADESTCVSYALTEAASFKERGMKSNTKILIAVGVGVAVLLVVAAIAVSSLGGSGFRGGLL
jgi:hypothetical protein